MLEIKTSRPAFDRIFATTLRSLINRVEPDGFCHTSFGECGNVKCYGVRHYLRDASEAARALALTGNVEKALAILQFNFRSVPAGQRHLPHVVNRDGSIQANSIQTDTLPHAVLAIEACAAAAGETAQIAALRDQAIKFADMQWDDHFHAEASLLDSGNYNEQGFAGLRREPLLDLFSNASNYAMCQALAPYGPRFGRRAQLLSSGIDSNLLDHTAGVYRAAIRLDGTGVDSPLNWISLYPVRWYRRNLAPYREAYRRLWETTCNDWGGGLLIPCCEEPALSFRTMGKVVAVLLAFAAQTGDDDRLGLLLDFIEKRTVRPAELWPECWFHHPPENPDEYLQWFFSEYRGVWTPFTEDPDGDYTIDSGNCEQSAVFIVETVRHLLPLHPRLDLSGKK